MFTFLSRTAPFPGLRRPLLLDSWRHSARFVWTQWELFLVAPAADRTAAFAAYMAALDAEAAAAWELAALSLPLAA